MIWFQLLMGHVMGDYILQPKVMAMEKDITKYRRWSAPFWSSLFWSVFHAILYTECVLLWLGHWTWGAGVLIFLTHWPIDAFSLGDRWLALIRGRTIRQAAEDTGLYRNFNIAFTAVVYTVVDNWWHLALMTPVVIIIQKGWV
jgi:hypothetical protein